MLRLLLDEHISPAVAAGIRRRRPEVVVFALADWERGEYLGAQDAACLQEAASRRLTFVTYDRRTIPPVLKQWAEEGRSHAGVIFVDVKTISPADVGGLVRSLVELAEESRNWDWADRVCYLHR